MNREATPSHERRPWPRRRSAATACLAVFALVLGAAADVAPRGDPKSRIPDAENASEYWDLAARFESGHALVARFMITHEGPGRNTGIAYGHFIEPDGTARPWTNGRREGNWALKDAGRVLDVGASDLYLTGPPHRLRVRKKKLGVDIDLSIEPEGPPAWDASERDGVRVDLLAAGATVTGSVWFREMPAPLALRGRAGLTHTWMAEGEAELALRRVDFFSLQGDTLVYLRETTAPDGARRRWLRASRGGKTLLETGDFVLAESGRSSAENDLRYPVPGELEFRADRLTGSITLGAGLLHHDPMLVIPQPFRFLLSFRLRPMRVWTESPYEIELSDKPGADPIRIHGSGVTIVTYLNTAPPAAR